jgi:hypothetical protein
LKHEKKKKNSKTLSTIVDNEGSGGVGFSEHNRIGQRETRARRHKQGGKLRDEQRTTVNAQHTPRKSHASLSVHSHQTARTHPRRHQGVATTVHVRLNKFDELEANRNKTKKNQKTKKQNLLLERSIPSDGQHWSRSLPIIRSVNVPATCQQAQRLLFFRLQI